MNLAHDWAAFLSDRGFQCQHWSDIGPLDVEDDIIAAHCAEQNAIVLTADLDFAQFHALNGTTRPSVIQLRGSDKLPSALGASVARTLSVARRELEHGAVVTVTSVKVRVSKLPIGNIDSV